MATTETTTENATIVRKGDVVALDETLRRLHEVRHDVVTQAANLRSIDGRLVILDGERTVTESGVGYADFNASMSRIFRGGIYGNTLLPAKYGEALRADPELMELFDENVNSLLQREPGRRFLVRSWNFLDGDGPMARALLSPKYKIMDDLPTWEAALEAMLESGVRFEVTQADVTHSRMYVRVACPDIAVAAPKLLENYRAPKFHGERPRGFEDDDFLAFAGFILTNSSVGHGRLTVTPRIELKVCSNGMIMTHDMVGKTHLGADMGDGEVEWSKQTERANRDLVKSQIGDVIRLAVSPEYVQKQITRLEETSSTPIPEAIEEPVIATVAAQLKWSDGERDSILRRFLRGGQGTAGGVMQAVTEFAQEVVDADRAYELESRGVEAMSVAVKATAQEVRRLSV